MQWTQELYLSYGFSVSSDVCLDTGVTSDALPTFSSAGGDEASFVDLEKHHAANKADLERSLAASEERSADAERRIKKFEHNKDTLHDLAIKFDDTEAKLKSYEEQVQFLGYKESEQNSPFVEKDASSSFYRERVVVLEKDCRMKWLWLPVLLSC